MLFDIFDFLNSRVFFLWLAELYFKLIIKHSPIKVENVFFFMKNCEFYYQSQQKSLNGKWLSVVKRFVLLQLLVFTLSLIFNSKLFLFSQQFRSFPLWLKNLLNSSRLSSKVRPSGIRLPSTASTKPVISSEWVLPDSSTLEQGR